MKKLLVCILVLGSINAFAEVECKSLNTDKEANKVTQAHINKFCDTTEPFSISDAAMESGSSRDMYVLSTRVCCTPKR